ncbi:aldose 1-epimerase family protein [Lacticaseibacillus mingshuiensis]|uniref:Aldose 1-epimerase family protein n=1 Tax=Lacticaseibacillus mingshuiensis TaxID=2799574 RepID=A0ABW4CFP3_9LACO|nr:aldose 1-epimerase family protein [Lacticaseibacillus mingshuiensis]
MITIKNEFLTVTINAHGAELTSVIDNHTGRETLWQADPAVWGRHAPVLFPIVGALKNGEYTYDGQTYKMGQHGFARDHDFTVTEADDKHAVFTLQDSEATRTNYPFAFTLTLTYTLENNNISVRYHVTNPAADAPLYFSVGGHPGFRIPATEDTAYTDYYMGFTPSKSHVTIPLSAAGIDYAHRTLAATDVNQMISHETFKNDALIFALNGKTKFSLRSDKTSHGVSLTTEDAPFLGVWSAYPAQGDYVCIEPWWGIADTTDASGELTEKLGINKLAPGEVFDHGYQITIF